MSGRNERVAKIDGDDYARSGFLLRPALFSERECDAMREWVDDLAMRARTPGGARRYNDDEAAAANREILSRVEYFRGFHEGLREVTESPRIFEILDRLLGEPAVLFKDKINYKIPGSSGFLPHQDAQAGWSRYCATHVTVLVSIDAMTFENGCLELASGQHRRGLIGDLWEPLRGASLEGLDFLPLRTNPGDACFFGSVVPHRSAPNRTNHPRRALYLTYNPASQGDHYETYFEDKRRAYPPDALRPAGDVSRYRV